MDAFHVIWTKPGLKPGCSYDQPGAQLLTMVVSALCWRYFNGKIRLYTDAEGLQFINRHHLGWVWSEPANTTLLNNIPHSIHAETYWAGAKIYVLWQSKAPATWLDTDLIITRKLHISNYPVTALHPETLDPSVYPDPESIPTASGYTLPRWFNNTVSPSNTAFLSVTNEALRYEYCNQAIRFMQNNPAPSDYGNLRQMVFAEQRMLAACAYNNQKTVNYLLREPFSTENDSCIHLWGYKNELIHNPDATQWYIHRLIHRFQFLTESFPEFRDFLKQFI